MAQETAVEWLMEETDIIFNQLKIDRMQAFILLVHFNEAKKKEIEYREKYKYSEKDLILAIDMARDVSDDGKDYKYSIKEILKHYE
jgi:hypothetical protein